MCELLAMSARFPTTISRSMTELARHGGDTGPHRDGWGFGFLDAHDALVVREPEPAASSRRLAWLREDETRASAVIAHIRRATQGDRLLRNTQPFSRELGGHVHLFAHNGMLPGIETDARFAAQRFRRIGDTDSEHAFCALLERLAPRWDAGVPSLPARLEAITAFAAELRSLGPANFLYSDGDVLFAHSHRRRTDRGTIEPPGLHVLCRTCMESTTHDGLQEVVLLASVPLTAEPWQPVAEGELLAIQHGRIVARVPSRDQVDDAA